MIILVMSWHCSWEVVKNVALLRENAWNPQPWSLTSAKENSERTLLDQSA
ncbi:MAG: hypothetical protein Tsb009_12520 [Planctomycetaceae bacterium]